jgi:hypothetical protein
MAAAAKGELAPRPGRTVPEPGPLVRRHDNDRRPHPVEIGVGDRGPERPEQRPRGRFGDETLEKVPDGAPPRRQRYPRTPSQVRSLRARYIGGLVPIGEHKFHDGQR